MSKVLLFLSLVCILPLKAQFLRLESDTTSLGQFKTQKDSLGKDILIRAYKQSTYQNNREFFSVAKSKTIQEKSIELPQTKYWETFKKRIPQGKTLLSINGQVRSESFATNAQNPMMRNEMVYSRLYISPTITLLGLPFTSNFFFTTESNNTYKNNFFSFRLDVAKLRQSALDQIQKELDDAKKLDRTRQVDLQKSVLESNRYEKELQNLEKQIPDYSKWQSELKLKAEEEAAKKLSKEKSEMEEKLKSASEEEKKALEEEYKQKQDSLVQAYKNEANDSFNNSGLNKPQDSAKINKYLRLQSKIEALQSKRKEIENLRQSDSLDLLKKTQGVRNPDDIRDMAKDQLPGKQLLQSVLAIDRIGIGLINPQYSEFTLYAASMKGLDIGINKKNYFYDISMGKTTRFFSGPFSTVKLEYDRHLAIARLGYGQLNGNHLSVEYLYAFDKEITDPLQPLVRNGVVNISGNFTLLNNIQIEANMAQSTYKEVFVKRENVVLNQGNTNQSLADANRAYSVKAIEKIGKNGKLEGSIKQTGAAFRTVGNPFLRRNFREGEIKFEQLLFKKKLKVSSFYKEMRDNLIEINAATNRFKGYGLKVSTSFEKYPNVTLSYSPYQQGNNHPDSLYRSNNQFSITTAMLTYKKRFKAFNWTAMVNYTRSAMEISNRGAVAYQLISAMQTFQVGKRNNLMLMYLSNNTAPSIDSLNSQSVQFVHTYLATKRITLNTIGEYTQYKNTAFKAGGGMQMNVNFKRNFSLGILTRYDKIQGLWNLKNENVYTGKVLMMWRI